MKVKVGGFNYEGAHFRMIDSDTDERNLIVVIEGEEPDICNYILDEFSYGSDDSVRSIRELAKLYDEGEVPNADGCGGVWLIELDGEILLDLRDEFVLTDEQRDERLKEIEELSKDLPEAFPLPTHLHQSPEPIELPPINLNEIRPDMNEYVARALGIPSLRERLNRKD